MTRLSSQLDEGGSSDRHGTARGRLVDRLLGLTVSGLDRAEPGDLMSRVTSDTALLRDVTTDSLVLMSLLDLLLFGVTMGVFSLAALVIGVVVPGIGRAARRTAWA